MRRAGVAPLSVLAILLAGCGSLSWNTKGLPTIPVQTPVATVQSWFAAINARKQSLALAHFAPADYQMMEWSSWGPRFKNVHCSLLRGVGPPTATSAVVRCTYDTINDPDAGMSNQNFWDVDLQRDPPGPWLIDNYGQG
jgi:hypothetical protein